MTLATIFGHAVDEHGDVRPNAKLEVRRMTPGLPMVQLFSDRDGETPIGNPVDVDADGFYQVFVPSFDYQVRLYEGPSSAPTFNRVVQWVPAGTAAAIDAEAILRPVNVAVDALADRDDYDDEAAGFVVLVTSDEDHDDEPTWYWKLSAGSADWSNGVVMQGPRGFPGSALVTATATDTLTVGTGEKVGEIVEDDERGFGVGARTRWASAANPTTHWMEGVVTAYVHPTLTVEMDAVGSGAGDSRDDWSISLAGRQGADGTDPGVLMTFDDGTADEDPGSGNIRADDADLAEAEWLYVSKANRAGDDIATWLGGFNDSTSTKKGEMIVSRPDGVQAMFDVAGVTDATGYVKVAIEWTGGAIGFGDSDAVSLQFYATGDAGEDGGGGDIGYIPGTDPTATSDSAAAIQSYLDGLTDGGTARLPAGTFRLDSTITVPNGVTLQGEGIPAWIVSTDTMFGTVLVPTGDVRRALENDVDAPRGQSARNLLIDMGAVTSDADGSITDITQADPAVVTSAGHALEDGDIVYLASIGGMTDLNDRFAVVAGSTTDTYQLKNIDSTGFSAYTSGGAWTLAPVGMKVEAAFDGLYENITVLGMPTDDCIGLAYIGSDGTPQWNTFSNVNLRGSDANKVGTGIVAQGLPGSAAPPRANQALFLTCRTDRCGRGIRLDEAGGGMTFINCTSERHAEYGVKVTNNTSTADPHFISGEIANNTTWGVDGRLILTNTPMSGNSSGDVTNGGLRDLTVVAVADQSEYNGLTPADRVLYVVPA